MILLLITALLSPDCHAYTVMALPGSVFSLVSEPPVGTAGKGELGLSLISGNTRSEQFATALEVSHRWEIETLVVRARYLESAANLVQSAQNWMLGSRYERKLAPGWGAFAGQSFEADRFAGLAQRYATDLGFRHRLGRDEKFAAAAEAGYRYQLENRPSGQLSAQVIRLFLETVYLWSKSATVLLGNEFLPDLSRPADWRLNSELDLDLKVNEQCSVVASYGARYDNVPAEANLSRTDRFLLTSIRAKF
jgi:putative salt-induced outer membrane protein YdiY